MNLVVLAYLKVTKICKNTSDIYVTDCKALEKEVGGGYIDPCLYIKSPGNDNECHEKCQPKAMCKISSLINASACIKELSTNNIPVTEDLPFLITASRQVDIV